MASTGFLSAPPGKLSLLRTSEPLSTCFVSRKARTSPRLLSKRNMSLQNRRATLQCSFTEDLATRAIDMSHTATDALISSVRDTLDLDGPSAVSGSQIREMVIHLADSRGMARLGLVDAFGRIGSPAVKDLLCGLTDCPNPVVRRSCGKALAKIGDPEATDTLINTLLHDEDTVTRSSAAGALAKMGALAVDRLLAVIANPDVSMIAKGHAAWAISFMRGEASTALFQRVSDSNPDVRLAVIAALGLVAVGDALPVMGGSGVDDWVEDDEDDSDEKEDVGGEIGEIHRQKAVEVLMSALEDESLEVRAEAVTGLANAGVYSAASQISSMFESSDMELRRSVAFALMKLRHVESLEKLRACGSNADEEESLRNIANLAAQSIAMSADDDDDW